MPCHALVPMCVVSDLEQLVGTKTHPQLSLGLPELDHLHNNNIITSDLMTPSPHFVGRRQSWIGYIHPSHLRCSSLTFSA